MTNDVNISNDDIKTDESSKKITNRLLTDLSFNRLRDAQQRISDETGLVPTLRKLINALVTEDSVNDVAGRFIEKLKEA